MNAIIKIIFLSFFIFCNILNADVFVSLGVMGSNGNIPIYLEGTQNSDNLISNGSASSISLSIGNQINLFESKLNIEPNIGYTSYDIDVYTINMFHIDLPLMYNFNLWKQRFSLGPNIKLYYLDSIEDDYFAEDYALTNFNSSYGFKFNLAFDPFDFFILYEYMNGDIFYSRWTGSESISSQIHTKGSYSGFGVRIRY